MKAVNLAERVQVSPGAAEVTFEHVEAALNLVLPGSRLHTRYREIEAVGLALVVGKEDVAPDTYNPLTKGVLEGLALAKSNQNRRPEAWKPLEIDAEILGGEMPQHMGRFTVFALAKINALTHTGATTSHHVEGVSIAPGQVGFAGARRTAQSLLAMSGLWEVHDHVAAQAYASNVVQQSGWEPAAPDTNTFRLAESFDRVFGVINRTHEGTEAAGLNRVQVASLLAEITPVLDEVFPLAG